MNDLKISTEYDGDVCTIAFSGEARLEIADQFEALSAEIEESKARFLLIDLSRLDFMDSASAGMLLRLKSEVTRRDGAVALFGLRRLVSRLFERTGLDDQFPTAETRDAALALLQ